MDLRPACPCPTFTRMNKRPQGYAGGDATVPVDEGFDAGFSSESLVFIKLEMYSVTARRSSPVLSRRRPFTARAISSVGQPALVQGRAGLERLVAALVVATGAPREEKLLACGEQPGALLF